MDTKKEFFVLFLFFLFFLWFLSLVLLHDGDDALLLQLPQDARTAVHVLGPRGGLG